MRSILPSLPDPKNSPLVVEALKATPKKQKVADDIAKIACKILSQLSYKGRWTIGLKQQINNKTDFVFKAINRHKNAIICRFKPGDNSTCWEVYLNPPAGYLVDQIVTDLRQVPLNGEIIRLPDARSTKTMALGIGKSKPRLPEPPKQPEVVKPLVEPPKVIEKIEPPKVEPVEPPKTEPITMTFRPLFPYNVQNHLSSKSLLDDLVILNTGLVAVCLGIDPANHDILRQFAVQIVLQELDLENLVKVNPNYNSALKAAGIIIRGLVNKGWLSRWMAPQRKKTPRVRDTTKGYLLTRTGKGQLEHIIKLHSDKITHNIQERLFHPELVVIQNEIEVNDEEETDDWDSLPSSEPSSTAKIPVEELVPLVKEFEARKKAIEECDVLIQDCLNSEKEIDNSFETLKNKLLRLKSEQSELEVQLGSLKGQRDKIYNDLQSARSLREEESKVFNNIKTKLGSAFD